MLSERTFNVSDGTGGEINFVNDGSVPSSVPVSHVPVATSFSYKAAVSP